jgi:hypothetical protein
VRHAATHSVEVEAQANGAVQQPAGGFIEREAARRRLFEDAFARQVAQHAVERVAVGAGESGEIADAGMPGGEVVGNAQSGGYV